jgi:hypothetical protein
MAKKNKKGGLFSLGNLLSLVAIAAGVVALCMIAMPSLTIEGKLATFGLAEDLTNYSGLKVVFGAKTEKYEYILFSFMNLLPYILVLVGLVVLALKVLGKMGGLANIIAVVAFVAAGVLFLLVPNFTILSEGFEAAIKVANLLTEVVSLKLATGALISAVCSFVAGVCALVPVFVKK